MEYLQIMMKFYRVCGFFVNSFLHFISFYSVEAWKPIPVFYTHTKKENISDCVILWFIYYTCPCKHTQVYC